MSYALVPYAVDLKKLGNLIGSGDAATLTTLLSVLDDRGEDEPDEVTLQKALSDLIMGKPADTRSPHQYGYALEQLCAHFGARLDTCLWEGVRWNTLEAVGVDKFFERKRVPVPLPRIPDFPAIACIALEEIPMARSVAQKSRECSDMDDIQALIAEFEDWLDAALQQKRSLFLFYY